MNEPLHWDDATLIIRHCEHLDTGCVFVRDEYLGHYADRHTCTLLVDALSADPAMRTAIDLVLLGEVSFRGDEHYRLKWSLPWDIQGDTVRDSINQVWQLEQSPQERKLTPEEARHFDIVTPEKGQGMDIVTIAQHPSSRGKLVTVAGVQNYHFTRPSCVAIAELLKSGAWVKTEKPTANFLNDSKKRARIVTDRTAKRNQTKGAVIVQGDHARFAENHLESNGHGMWRIVEKKTLA